MEEATLERDEPDEAEEDGDAGNDFGVLLRGQWLKPSM